MPYFVGILLAILAFPSMRGIVQMALGGAGVLAVVAGVAFQESLANLVGGVVDIFFKPWRHLHPEVIYLPFTQ